MRRYDGIPEPEWYRKRIELEEDLDDLRECFRKQAHINHKWQLLTICGLLAMMMLYYFVRR